jgi:hypothetical protein
MAIFSKINTFGETQPPPDNYSTSHGEKLGDLRHLSAATSWNRGVSKLSMVARAMFAAFSLWNFRHLRVLQAPTSLSPFPRR